MRSWRDGYNPHRTDVGKMLLSRMFSATMLLLCRQVDAEGTEMLMTSVSALVLITCGAQGSLF